ncbi:MAG: DUF4400 domain-containing protein [Azoarcus sp.]|nr:DUF4400 domain-containing protein [Azoarcus sp.]
MPVRPDRQAAELPGHLGGAGAHAETYVIAAAYTALVFLARLLVLLLGLPLFLLAAFTGLVDGLARRDVRRFGAGRESGFAYHRAWTSLTPLAVLPWVIYLALPISVAPLFILRRGALGACAGHFGGDVQKYL